MCHQPQFHQYFTWQFFSMPICKYFPSQSCTIHHTAFHIQKITHYTASSYSNTNKKERDQSLLKVKETRNDILKEY